MCGGLRSLGAPESKASFPQWQSGLIGQNLAQTPPHTTVVGCCEFVRLRRVEGAQEELGSGCSAKRQEEPRRLCVRDGGNSIKQHTVVRNLLLKKPLDIRWMSKRNSQHLESLLIRVQTGVSSPHHCLRRDVRCLPLQSGAIGWIGAAFVPHLCLACVQGDSAFVPQMDTKEVVDCSHPVWFADHVKIVQISEQSFSLPQTCRDRTQCRVLARQKSSGIKGSPCSPPSPCGIEWTSPTSSSHK